MSAPAGPPPTVSVVVATYNGARWLRETLASVLAQTFRDFEVVAVDDGSTDGTTPALLAEVAAREGDLVPGGPSRVRVVTRANGGAASARNEGVRQARGRLVAFVDHDDLWRPEKLARQVALFEAEPALAWAYCDAEWFDSDTGEGLGRQSDDVPLREGDVLEPLLLGNFVPFASGVVRRDVFLDVGGLNEAPLFRHVDDWDLWLRVAERHPVRAVRAPLVRYRVHRTQATRTMDLAGALASRIAVIDAAVARSPGRLGPLREAAVAGMELNVARHLMNRERRGEARRLLARALRRRPGHGPLWTFLAASYVPRPALRALGRVRARYRDRRARAA